jgi:hypothetical protein
MMKKRSVVGSAGGYGKKWSIVDTKVCGYDLLHR